MRSAQIPERDELPKVTVGPGRLPSDEHVDAVGESALDFLPCRPILLRRPNGTASGPWRPSCRSAPAGLLRAGRLRMLPRGGLPLRLTPHGPHGWTGGHGPDLVLHLESVGTVPTDVGLGRGLQIRG